MLMKSTLIVAVATLATGVAALASPLDGVWHTARKHGGIELYDCGAQVCGRIVDGDDLRTNPDVRDARNKDETLRSRRLKGLVILKGFNGGPTEWKGGSVYNPEDGNTYHGSLTLVDSTTMHLKGCVFGPLCQTDTWTRTR